MAQASGMAAAIRGSTESDTFDLAGQNVSTIRNTMQSAFQEALPIQDMIRITFVTGAGKLGRQKYDDGAAKAVTAALRELSFEEDRGASCVRECAGSFKMQHDTGKNLKTVVVFPNIQAADAGGDDAQNGAAGSTQSPVLRKNSPEEMIALSSVKVFETMIKSRCASWSQKKGAVAALTSVQAIIDGYDQKLLKGTPLEDNEQDLYDTATALDEKITLLRNQMHQQVDDGKLTQQEKEMLLQQVTEKLEAATKDNKPKLVQKLQARKAKLTDISASTKQTPLKFQNEILKLNLELRPLLALEESTKGRLLSIKETQTLARKDEIDDEILEYERKSRGWFEDDVGFEARVQACRDVCASRNKTAANKKKGKKATPAASSASTKASFGSAWTSAPSKSRGRLPAAARRPVAKSSNSKGASGLFAAMMGDSDSD